LRRDASDDQCMMDLILAIGRGLALTFRGRQELALENLALRQQPGFGPRDA